MSHDYQNIKRKIASLYKQKLSLNLCGIQLRNTTGLLPPLWRDLITSSRHHSPSLKLSQNIEKFPRLLEIVTHIGYQNYPTSEQTFCETRSKRSVEVYKGRNLDQPPPPPHR